MKFIRLALLSALIFIGLGQIAHSQFLPTTAPEPKGLETLLEEARKDGSTVIVVSPAKENADDGNADASVMRAERFLRVRARVGEIFSSGTTVWERARKTLDEASPDGSFFWLLRAMGTAFLGMLLAYWATRKTYQWASANFAWIQPNEPKNNVDKVQYLVVRTCMSFLLVGFAFLFTLPLFKEAT